MALSYQSHFLRIGFYAVNFEGVEIDAGRQICGVELDGMIA
jgi:hypothetical protein